MSPTDPPALAVEGLSKTFDDGDDEVVAVDDISLTVDTGEVVGLLGPNGAGKTTTIKSILGLVLPDTGTVEIDGIDVYGRPRKAYERVDAMLEGARNDYWRLTVRENLRYFAAIRGRDPDELTERHEGLLDRFDIADEADTAVRDLSRGMKQKVSLASVLVGDVSVAFLDEPTLGLDVESSLTLRREIVRLAEERDLTLVVSTHDMDVVEDVCDRVIIVSDGSIVADRGVDELLAAFETRGYRVTARGLDAETLARLRREFEVAEVDHLGDRTRIEVVTDSEGFYRLTDVLEAAGVELADVEAVQPDLEEAFLQVTEETPGPQMDPGAVGSDDGESKAGKNPKERAESADGGRRSAPLDGGDAE